MQKNRYFPLSLIAAGILSACSTVPPENATLSDARSSYNSARSNPQVTQLAPLELKEAGETLGKADAALTKGETEATVNQLAYLAKQKVAIAEETARRKNAELEVASSSAKRDQVRLEARTAEADAAKQRAEIAQQASDEQAAALTEARIQAERDQALINARMAEVEEARQQATLAQQAADQRAAALAEANAKAERAQALIAQQEMQLKELNAKKTDRGMVITLGDVLFNVNKAALSSGGIANVKKLAEFLQKYPQRNVVIEGHTDSQGSDSYNQALSERRAEAVQKTLVEMGISRDRIATRGYGESTPVANNETAAGRQLNRRVEIVLPDAVPDAQR